MLRLKDLRTFLIVCDTGAFGRAADVLNTAQSHVGARMRRMEHDIGAPLFHRLHRGIRPTPKGELLYRHAQRVFREIDDLERSVMQRDAA